VDFSYCQLGKEDVTAIADGFRDNHTLLGFHLKEGNQGKLD
jgi:hypothetical protein